MKKDVAVKPLLFPTPVLIVATYDDKGAANAMTAAWGGICCSDPFCVTVSQEVRSTEDKVNRD